MTEKVIGYLTILLFYHIIISYPFHLDLSSTSRPTKGIHEYPYLHTYMYISICGMCLAWLLRLPKNDSMHVQSRVSYY